MRAATRSRARRGSLTVGGGEQVKGNDGQPAVVTMKFRVVEAAPAQLAAWRAAHPEPKAVSPLVPAVQPALDHVRLGAGSAPQTVPSARPAPPSPPSVKGPAGRRPGRVEVTIVRGLHFPKTDAMGKIDAYCEGNFGKQEIKTDVIKSNFSPNWNTPTVLEVDDVSKVVFEGEGGGGRERERDREPVMNNTTPFDSETSTRIRS